MCKHVAAVLYGIGTRLDQQTEVLFSLRRVDAKDLVQQAEVGLKPSGKRVAPSKVLDGALLGNVFGIEMAEAALPTKPTARKAAAKKVVKAATESTAKPRKPAASTTAAAAKKAAASPKKTEIHRNQKTRESRSETCASRQNEAGKRLKCAQERMSLATS